MARRTSDVSFPRSALKIAFALPPMFSLAILNSCESDCNITQGSAKTPLRHLRVGEFVDCVVYAQRRRNDTLLLVRAGEHYQFKVSPPNHWSDWWKPSSADGYPSTFWQKPWEHGRVIPSANWFALCGEISRNEQFLIGSDLHDYPCRSTGALFLFANDHPLFYWNNCGQISVSILRKE
jgi:hypothetical protein